MGSNKFYCKLGEGIIRCPCPCAPNDGGCGSCPTWYYYVLGILGGIGILGFLCWVIGSCCEKLTQKK